MLFLAGNGWCINLWCWHCRICQCGAESQVSWRFSLDIAQEYLRKTEGAFVLAERSLIEWRCFPWSGSPLISLRPVCPGHFDTWSTASDDWLTRSLTLWGRLSIAALNYTSNNIIWAASSSWQLRVICYRSRWNAARSAQWIAGS